VGAQRLIVTDDQYTHILRDVPRGPNQERPYAIQSKRQPPVSASRQRFTRTSYGHGDQPEIDMIGKVIDNQDPEKKGRVKLRIIGLTDDVDASGNFLIPTNMLAWARNGNGNVGGDSTGAGNFSVPKLNAMVRCEGDLYSQVYFEQIDLNEKMLEEIGGNYEAAHVLLYDTDLAGDGSRKDEHIKIYFTDNTGVVVEYKTPSGVNAIRMTADDAISIENASGVKISIDGKDISITGVDNFDLQAKSITLGDGKTESAMTFESFRSMFNQHTHLTNYGPTQPPQIPATTQGKSGHVKVKT